MLTTIGLTDKIKIKKLKAPKGFLFSINSFFRTFNETTHGTKTILMLKTRKIKLDTGGALNVDFYLGVSLDPPSVDDIIWHSILRNSNGHQNWIRYEVPVITKFLTIGYLGTLAGSPVNFIHINYSLKSEAQEDKELRLLETLLNDK